jgi:diguanylate cyclase (GGDEF)-like protein
LDRFFDNPEIVKHYDLLHSLGILDELTSYSKRVRNLEEVISDAIEIFNQHSTEDLIDYITSNLVDRFIPEYLQFVFTIDGSGENLRNLCFYNLKPAETPAPIPSLEPYRRFFRRYPSTISFPLFEYYLDNPEATGALAPLNPEIVVPIVGPRGLYGIIIVGSKIVEGGYSSEEIVYLDRLMKFASLSLQNTIHYTSSVTDYKTGLYNHSFFNKRLEEELAKVQRYDHAIGLLLMDIDFFKHLNDRHGHLAGDKVLYELARTLEDELRKEDVIARFGGEEFIVLLPSCSKKSALQVAERLRTAIEAMEVAHGETALHITISIGIEHIDSSNVGEALQHYVDLADKALYMAKERGRNRVVLNRAGLLHRAFALQSGE